MALLAMVVTASMLMNFLPAVLTAQTKSTINLVAVDANPDGNTKTSLGPRDTCVRTEPGSKVSVDVTVDSVPADRPAIGMQLNVHYDPNLLQVTDVNNEMLLSANGSYQPFEGLGDSLPDSDGNLLIEMADLASNEGGQNANTETGAGALSRVTFEAKAAGESNISLGFVGGDEYPALIDTNNETIGVNQLASALIEVGQDCPSSPPPQVQPSPLPPIEQVIAQYSRVVGTNESPTPPGQTAAPGSETPSGSGAANGSPGTSGGASGSPSASGSTTPKPSGSVTPTPKAGAATTDNGSSNTGTVVAVAALAVAGAALVGGGGWLLYRRMSMGR